MVSIGKGLTKKIQKTIAFFLLISFTLLNTSQNSFTYAETLPVSSASHHGIKKANPNALLGSFELPEELGIIQERFIPENVIPGCNSSVIPERISRESKSGFPPKDCGNDNVMANLDSQAKIQ